MTSEVHRRLRETTLADHQRLETRADVVGRAARPEGRRDLVERFWSLHAGAERGLEAWLGPVREVEFERRRRSPWLAHDLATLGGERPPAAEVSVASVAEALGVLYVLEGSTLGGRVIRKRLEAEGQNMEGLSFLDPYGGAVGARWKALLAVLDAHGRTPAEIEGMVAGATAGFRLAENRLCEARAHG